MDASALQRQINGGQVAMAALTLLNFSASIYPADEGAKFDNNNSTEADTVYDFIIIGLGAAGGILADQLTQSGRFKVLGIDAGGQPLSASTLPGLLSYLPGSQADANYTSKFDACSAQQLKGNVFSLTNGQVLGGSTSLNYMVYARGAPRDYAIIAEQAKDPTFSYNTMIPYFRKSERLEDKEVLNSPYGPNYGKNGRIGMARQPSEISKKYLNAFREINERVVLDTNGYNTVGVTEPMLMISGGKRQSTAFTSLALASNRTNLDVLLNTKVTKVLIDNQYRAYGVQARRPNGQILTFRAKREVLLCAGTIGSAQLLMLSGIGNRTRLQKLGIPVKANLPVGEKFRDHTGVIFVHKLNITNDTSPPPDPHQFPSSLVVASLALNKQQRYADYRARNFIFPSDSNGLLTQCSILNKFKNKVCQSFYKQTRGYQTMYTKLGKLHPVSRGKVLIKTTDPDDQPSIIPNYYSFKKDLNDTVNYLMDFLRIQNSTTFKRYNAEFVYPDLPACDNIPRPSRAYYECYAVNIMTSQYDYGETCSIGSVVDNRFKVYGIKGLRVIDGSVLSYLTSGGLQGPVMGIAYKAADIISLDNLI